MARPRNFREFFLQLQGLPPESLREQNPGGFGTSPLSPEEMRLLKPNSGESEKLLEELDGAETELDNIPGP